MEVSSWENHWVKWGIFQRAMFDCSKPHVFFYIQWWWVFQCFRFFLRINIESSMPLLSLWIAGVIACVASASSLSCSIFSSPEMRSHHESSIIKSSSLMIVHQHHKSFSVRIEAAFQRPMCCYRPAPQAFCKPSSRSLVKGCHGGGSNTKVDVLSVPMRTNWTRNLFGDCCFRYRHIRNGLLFGHN